MMSKMLRVQRLKPRQFEVMRRIALGQKSLEIAKALGMRPSTVKTIRRKPEAREYLTLYLELLNLISDIAQANQTLEALQAHQDLLAQRAGIKELIEFARNLMDLTGKKEFTETLSRLKRTAQKLIDSPAA
jgi:nitrate reductase assembly molybdenum cofactor insertion protein NarJ